MNCPTPQAHTPGPADGPYGPEWQQWALEMAKTHRQEECPGCHHHWLVWVPAADPRNACRNCRRPVHWVPEVGSWLHGELPQYAGEPLTCGPALPVIQTA
jgi:hypothetical protein